MKQIPSGCVSFLVFLTKIIIVTANLNIKNETEIKNSTKTITDIGDYLKNYNTNIRPIGENGTGPVKVHVDLFIRSISNVDEAKMEYSLQLTLRETWIDSRLAYGRDQENSSDYLVLGAEQEIWRPDTFIYNEKHAQKHDVDRPNVLKRVYKDGKILYSVRLTLTLSCPMNLKNYPLDIQHCMLKMASYAWTTDDIVYAWRDLNPIQLTEGLQKSLPQFTLSNVTVGYCHSITITGDYSCLMVEFELAREFGYYIVHLYLPGILLVFVSWISFWLDPSSVPGRVTLGVTTLLTMATQASSVSAHLPPVSYAKAIDIWIGMCTSYLFGSLIEFAIVTFLYDKQMRQNKNILEELKSKKNLMVINKPWAIRRLIYHIEKDAKLVDNFSRIAFPTTFLISNVIYWIYYTQDWFH